MGLLNGIFYWNIAENLEWARTPYLARLVRVKEKKKFKHAVDSAKDV